jgi:hypothetical protein
MSMRNGARLQSLCGTARRIKKKKKQPNAAMQLVRRGPCRHHAIWACQGAPDRERRLAELTR